MAAPKLPPGGFVDGFNWKTVVGAFFVGIVMMPAAIYISLFAGQGLGPAAEWVTIILFAELARRSISALSKQEMYLLYHVAAGLAGGGAFGGLIWNQFLRQSREAAAFGVAQGIPLWAAPAADSPGILERKLWHHDWWPVIGLVLVGQILSRLNWFGLGYALFRITSDVERLPFPLASIAAEGATALAEHPEEKGSWRWRVFSMGSMLGLAFGLVYIGLPAITYLIFARSMSLLPIPFADFTTSTESFLPAAPIAFTFDLGTVIWGFVVPFWAVVGGFAAMILTSIVGNPILQSFGFFPHWKQGMGVLNTAFATSFDFWLSIGIGATLAVAGVGIWQLIRVAMKKGGGTGKGVTGADVMTGREGSLFAGVKRGSLEAPKGRGDFPLWIAVAMFMISTTGYVWLCHYLVPKFPLWILAFFGFVWTPLISYVSARMIGLTGSGVGVPFVKEGSFILTGYKGVDIWFAPIPLNDFGGVTTLFKQLELTRTKFTSIIKAELLMLPIGVAFSFIFWAFIWYLTAVPSYGYPWASKIWPFNALTNSLWMSATSEGRTWLLEAIRVDYVATGAVAGAALYGMLTWLSWPIFIFYGAVGGINAQPGGPLLLMIGALLGRYYFAPKYGADKWFKYAPVLGAGFACGAGLISMLAVGLTIVRGTVVTKPF